MLFPALPLLWRCCFHIFLGAVLLSPPPGFINDVCFRNFMFFRQLPRKNCQIELDWQNSGSQLRLRRCSLRALFVPGKKGGCCCSSHPPLQSVLWVLSPSSLTPRLFRMVLLVFLVLLVVLPSSPSFGLALLSPSLLVVLHFLLP